MIHWAGVFLGMALVDYLYSEWVRFVAAGFPVRAGLLAAGLIVVTGYVTKNYVERPVLLVPAAAGAFVGTWISVWSA